MAPIGSVLSELTLQLQQQGEGVFDFSTQTQNSRTAFCVVNLSHRTPTGFVLTLYETMA